MNLRNLLLAGAVAVAAVNAGAVAFAAGPDSSTATVTGKVTIIRPISITTDGADLNFGTIVKPSASGTTGVVTISNAATATRTIDSTLAVVGSFSRPTYTISGEGGQAYNLTVGTLTLSNGSASLPVTLSPSIAAGSHTFTGSVGTGATQSLYIGAAITVADTTTTGAYSGSYDVTVSYN